MPTDTSRSPTRARSFALRAVAWSLGLFGFLRLGWVETHAVLPLTRLQGRLAIGVCGTSACPVEATLTCSGTDALALCLGVILAYPARWRTRLAGAAGGVGLVLGLNTLRIGTLGRAAASPTLFETLHLHVWPAILTLAIAGYVFAWMRLADRQGTVGTAPGIPATPATPASPHERRLPVQITRRFVLLTAGLLLLFTAAAPLYLESARVLVVAAFVARAAAAVLRLAGVAASAAANVLWTPRGGFMVTQECISTPLIPVYLAAVLAYSRTWRGGALGLLAAAPLFVGLGIARLLVVALPPALAASPAHLIHSFNQVLLAAVLVFLAALWRHGAGASALRRALPAIALGAAFVLLLGAPYSRLATAVLGDTAPTSPAANTPVDDPQGAIAALPAFQVGLYLAVWVAAFAAVGWRRFLAGLALLALTQFAVLLALHALAAYYGLTPPVRDIRAWAVVGPLLVIAAVANASRRLRSSAAAASPGAEKARG